MGILNSLLGMVALLAIAFALSKHKINQQTHRWGGICHSIWFGRIDFVCASRTCRVGNGVQWRGKVLSYGNQGVSFFVWRLG